jgi:hypothetical protein
LSTPAEKKDAILSHLWDFRFMAENEPEYRRLKNDVLEAAEEFCAVEAPIGELE